MEARSGSPKRSKSRFSHGPDRIIRIAAYEIPDAIGWHDRTRAAPRTFRAKKPIHWRAWRCCVIADHKGADHVEGKRCATKKTPPCGRVS
jgi:hypothetical protein